MAQQNIQLLFQDAVERFPNHVAIDSSVEQISYLELERRANSLARFLSASGVQPGSLVAILAENTTEVVVSIIGILKAGCAFVPLDPRAPATRLEMMLNQVSPRWLLAEAKFGGVIGALRLANSLKMNVVWLDRAGEVSTNESGLNFVEGLIGYENLEPISVPMEPDALCYVYFTSGSTGKPKGIAGRLKGIAHFVRWEIESFDVGAKTRVSQLTTPAFDAFLRDIFTPLCAGGTVCVPEPRESVLDAEGLVRWVESAQLNLIHCVPSVFRLLLGGEISPGHFQSLRHILLAGEPLLPADVKRWTSVFGDRIQLVNLYGPSETTMTKFFYRVSVSDGEAKSVPIGQPMPGARAVVVDERGKICRVGGVGEIYIRTPYCALGYYKEPELTEAVFVANPFDTAASDIVYKTGDIGCLRADGNFELFGRKDNQVKINGVRIELSEIESCLLNHPVIEDAAVVPRTDGRPAPYLCAYVVGHAKVETAALREYLAGHLPPYMLPSSIVVMEALPRTFTGKVNRQALPPPRESRSEYVAPRNQIEELLAGLFSQLLKTDRIGVNDNFFDLGGQSILAMQLLARIKDSFGIDIALRDLFTVADLGGLSRLIETALSRGELQTIKPIVPVARDGEIPLSFSQERFWFLEQLNAGTAAYHVPVAVRINGELRFDALEAALNEIIRRHEALRTGFEHRLGKTVQVIAPTIQLAVRRVDARHLQGDAQLPELHRLYREEISQTFNLGRPPLLRATLFQLSDREHTLLVTMHHIICDAWSLNIFFREVGALYRATLSGEPAPLPPLPIQYADFACWQRSIGDAVADAQLIYWKQQLANLQPLQLPTDRPRPPIPSFRGANQSLSFSPETCAALKALSQQNGVTLFMTLLAAFQSLLSRYTRQSDITVGTPIANRSRTEIEGLIGFFANTLTLHTDFSGDPTFEELLRRVRDIALGAYMHQDVAFEQVVNHVQPERDLSRQPLFQVMFVLQNAPVDEVELPATTLSSFEVESGTAPFDLTVELYEADGCINGRINYSRDLFEAATIERLARHFVLLVEGAVAEPTQRVSALPILTHEERRQLLPTDTLPVYPQSICLHELFEQQVREHPDAIALVFKNERLTYQQLNARANQLAHHLQSLGVGPDVLVALCLDQSLELVVGILGILKAGGAYVPLDPAAPTARLAYVLADTSAKVLLTKKDLQERLPEALPVNTVYLDAEAEILARYADDCPTSGVQPENLAYVIYTSGSTGQPKGVPVEHRNVVRLFEATQGFYQFNSADVWTLFHSYAFDFSVWELWGALLYGGRLVVVPYWLSRSPEAFYELLRAESITVLNQTPSAFWQLVEAEANLGAKQKLALRYVIFGGEALEMRRLKPWFERHGDVMPRLVNMYGITETTVHVTFRPITTDDVDATFSSAIGQPIADLRVYILDEHLQPNPSGVPGELCIGGDGLSRGYLGNPALTAQRFVPDPFSARAGARLYRSGDSARYRNDGDIEYLGRIDRQVKVRGFRIELGEIEASLHQHDEIKEAVVVVREDTPGDKRLVGYVVPEHKQAISLASQQLYRLPNDLEVAYLNKSDTDLLYHELYVERSYFDGGISVNDGDCIFDVGANIGLFTLFINQAFRNTRVYAFEPIPPIFARLSDNVALYNLNVKLFECGLSSQTGTATFTFYPQMTVMSGRYADAGEDEKLVKAFISNQSAEMSAHADELLEGKFKRESFDCRLRTISDVIHEENIERIDLLKIDTEKSEVDVLEGIEDADWKKIKQISLEVHGDERLAQVRAILERHAYHFTVKPNDETEHTGLYNVYALRHSAADNASTGRQENHPASLHTLEKHLLSANELRGYLKDKLPDYMIPATFVLLSELPLTSNGKVDRKALPLPEQARQSVSVNEFAEPQTEAERLLAEIWSQVLGIEHVGVRDSFFSLGGDSILSLQIIARARRVGLHLTPKQLFQHQTIASLAALPEISGANPPAIKAEQGVVSGDVPLTPIQHWFFEQDLSDAHYLNQAIAFESRQALNPALIEQVWRRLIEHHDVLRLRFVKEDEGWRQFIVAEENNRVFSIHDFSGLSADEQASAISTATAELQASLNLTHGPLLRIAYFDLGSGRPSRLLFIIHHLAVDTVSWRILLDDFQTLYRSLASGRVPQLPSKTTSFQQWSRQLLDYAPTVVNQQRAYWLNRPPLARARSFSHNGRQREDSAQTVKTLLGTEETRRLLQAVPAAYQTQINDVLLTGLVQAFARQTGEHALCVDVEGHGREHLWDGIDVSRTVGWFTSMFPVVLQVEAGSTAVEALSQVREQLERIPEKGVGYGVLRYLIDGEVARELRVQEPAEVRFNYLGQVGAEWESSELMKILEGGEGQTFSERAMMSHTVAVEAVVSRGQLRVEWRYSGGDALKERIEGLAHEFMRTLEEIVRETANRKHATAEPARARAFKLITTADRLHMPEGVEDAYPLAMLQLGMLFHSDFNQGTAAYHDVFTFRLQTPFDLDALHFGLQRLASRHAVLRTSFDLTSFSEPLQLVHQSVVIPVHVEDLSQLPDGEREDALRTWLESERRRSLDWTRAPLLSIYIHHLTENIFEFTLSFHHAILDGWSVASLLTELFQHYSSAINNQPPFHAPPLAHSYRDFVALEREAIASAEFRDFWNHKLEGSNFAKLPRWVTPQESDAVQSRPLEVSLGVEISDSLKRLAQTTGVSLKSVLLTAHFRVMSLLCNQPDVVTGLVVHSRLAEVGGDLVLGLFLNTVPMRMQARGGTWRELVRSTFETEAELLPYRSYPLALMQRGRGNQPLFESIFNFTHYHVYRNISKLNDIPILDGKILEEINFPLTVNFSLDETTGEVYLTLLYDSLQFTDEQLNAVAGYFTNTLSDMARHPDRRYELSSLLSTAEQQQLLLSWNNTHLPELAGGCFHEIFEAQAARAPGRTAVVGEDRQWSYGELNRRANRLAHKLREHGVRPEGMVGVFLQRSPELLVALLAILKAGAAYVPFDPHYPTERLAYMIEDAGLSLLLTETSLLDVLPENGCRKICLDVEAQPRDARDVQNLPCNITGDNLAYVIYTSGSTGKPKGVQVTHSGLVNLLRAMNLELKLSADDRLLAVTSLSFDIAALELFLPLTLGAEVAIADRMTTLDGNRLAQRLDEWGATVMQATPATWRMLLESGWQNDGRLKILCGGEALTRDLAESLKSGGSPLWNLYGPTETTIWSMVHQVETVEGSVPLGHPLANTEIYILDRHLQPVPTGTSGELYIGGDGLARGYLHKPELTAERFVPHPFSRAASGGRLYRTGDLVSYTPSGGIKFLGRVDFQVKVRGFRLELGEVEAALSAHQGVKACVVAARTQPSGEQRLVAYVTPSNHQKVTDAELRRFLLDRLPDYMVPNTFINLDAFPLTPNGKIDRAALPTPAQERPDTESVFVAPRDQLELELAQMWEDLLEIKPVGVKDHFFFNLGAHSLQAIRLVARIRESFGIAFNVSELFQTATVERLAAYVRRKGGENEWSPIVAIQPHGARRPFFCVHPAFGNVMSYIGLSRHLGTEQPFYGLQAPGIDGRQEPLTQLPELASYYLAALRQVQPAGPYLLGGHSFGGVVAFEMAHQLLEQGDEVGLLALFDTVRPDQDASTADFSDDARWLSDTARIMERFFDKEFHITYEELRGLTPEDQLRFFMERLTSLDVLMEDAGTEMIRGILNVQKALSRAALDYVFRPYPGKITMFRASEINEDDATRMPASVISDETLGWRSLASGSISVHYVAGDHVRMLTEPYVAELAARLRVCLDEAYESGAVKWPLRDNQRRLDLWQT